MQNYQSQTKVDFASSHEVKVSLHTSLSTPREDFIINYELSAPPLNGTMQNYNDDSEEFFFHVFSPQREDLGGQAMPKEIIFVLDKSGSMEGRKIEQLKAALSEIIGQLPKNDSFNIVIFDNSIRKYEYQLISANKSNKQEPVRYINNIQAGGSTNINDALTTALGMFTISETRVPIIVMLTDGLPTAGVTNPATIRENIKNKNTAGVAIFCLGFGFDVDFEFLKAMSLENSGIAIRIYEGEDASEQITDFYETISTPLLKGLRFDYTEGAYEVFPTKVDQLFEGAEVVVVGKIESSANEITSTVDANSWEGMKLCQETFELKNRTNNSFIPRFWAYAKIRYLLDEIAVSGENDSLVENITNLALEYSFVTPYTSLLVEITEPVPEKQPGDKDSDNDGLPDEWELAHGTDPYDPNDSNLPFSDKNNIVNHTIVPCPDSEPSKEKKKSGKDDLNEIAEEAGLDMMACSVVFIIIPFILIIFSVLLYTKIKRSRLLEQKRREMIFNYIKEHPGEHFRGIQKALNLGIGVVSHHVNKLESEEFIKSRQDGQYRRFYPFDAKIDVKLILSQIQQNILNWIKTNPGIARKTIASNLGVERELVTYHVNILQNAGFIYTQEQGNDTICYMTAGV